MLPCLLGVIFVINHERFLTVGEQLLCSLESLTALPGSAQTSIGVQKFSKAEKSARIPSRHKKLEKLFTKIGNGTNFSSKEVLTRIMQDFKEISRLL